jgi:hypothetical protein
MQNSGLEGAPPGPKDLLNQDKSKGARESLQNIIVVAPLRKYLMQIFRKRLKD